jgi:uncharacterized membrane protein
MRAPQSVGRRQRGQTIVLAAVAMVAVVGGLAMVVDAGMFFVIQRQLQTAADAGALAAVWYDPVCPGVYTGAPPNGCLTSRTPVAVAQEVAKANADTIKQLCGGTVVPATVTTGTTLIRPSNVSTVVVTVECEAGYSFGRILNLNRKHLTASAAAALGNRTGTVVGAVTTCYSDMTDLGPGAPCGYIARLID